MITLSYIVIFAVLTLPIFALVTRSHSTELTPSEMPDFQGSDWADLDRELATVTIECIRPIHVGKQHQITFVRDGRRCSTFLSGNVVSVVAKMARFGWVKNTAQISRQLESLWGLSGSGQALARCGLIERPFHVLAEGVSQHGHSGGSEAATVRP